MLIKNSKKMTASFSIIEIIVAGALLSVVGVMIVLSIQLYLTMSNRNSQNVRAAIVLEETSEIIRFMRDESWENINSLNLDKIYYINIVDGIHTIDNNSAPDRKFNRSFSLHEIVRDSENKISTTGEVDENTFLINLEIYWFEQGNKQSIKSEMLIHNINEN